MPTVTLNPGDKAAHNLPLTNGVETVVNINTIRQVDIISSGEAKIYFTLDGTPATIAGPRCYQIPASPGIDTRRTYTPANLTSQVRLIADGTVTVSVVATD